MAGARNGRGTAWQGNGIGAAWARHAKCESAFILTIGTITLRPLSHIPCLCSNLSVHIDSDTQVKERSSILRKKILLIRYAIDFGGLGVACWPLASKFAGSNPAEAVGFLGRKKILSTPSFGGEVKPSVPCCRFTACKRALNLRGIRNLGKITGQFLAHSSTFRC